MRRSVVLASLSLLVSAPHAPAGEEPLQGFTLESSGLERQWEDQFRALPSPDKLREYLRRMSARPHHVGSPYGKDNAEWILARFKE